MLISLLAGSTSTRRTRASLQVQILALRRQLTVLQRNRQRRVLLCAWDRLLWPVLVGLRHIFTPNPCLPALLQTVSTWSTAELGKRGPGAEEVGTHLNSLRELLPGLGCITETQIAEANQVVCIG